MDSKRNEHIENLIGNGWHHALAILNWAFVFPCLENEGALKIMHAYQYLYHRGAH